MQISTSLLISEQRQHSTMHSRGVSSTSRELARGERGVTAGAGGFQSLLQLLECQHLFQSAVQQEHRFSLQLGACLETKLLPVGI